MVHFIAPFLYALTLISFNFYTVICFHLLLGVNQLGYFVSLGGYFDDDLAVLCGIAFMDIECDQPVINFNFLLGALSTCHFCLEINFAFLHCILNLESSPRRPHALAWGPWVAPLQKSFGSSGRDWKPLLAMVRFASIRSWQIQEILTFLPPRWRMPPGLLWSGHVIWIGIC